MMMTQNALPQYLMRQLKDDGLMNARWQDANRLLLRVQAHLPRVQIRGREAYAEWADVMVTFVGDRLRFHIEHPEPEEVLHPNWSGDGYWRESKALNFVYRDERAFVELLRYMIGGLKLKLGCFTLDEPINRNAVSWCHRHGKVPIQLVSTSPAAPEDRRPPRRTEPRVPVTVSEVIISPRRFEE